MGDVSKNKLYYGRLYEDTGGYYFEEKNII